MLSLSISGAFSPSINAAVDQMVRLNIVVVVAAGNDGQDACLFSPGSATGALTVGALTPSDSLVKAPPSNWGNCVNVFAPGYGVKSTYLKNGTALMR